MPYLLELIVPMALAMTPEMGKLIEENRKELESCGSSPSRAAMAGWNKLSTEVEAGDYSNLDAVTQFVECDITDKKHALQWVKERSAAPSDAGTLAKQMAWVGKLIKDKDLMLSAKSLKEFQSLNKRYEKFRKKRMSERAKSTTTQEIRKAEKLSPEQIETLHKLVLDDFQLIRPYYDEWRKFAQALP